LFVFDAPAPDAVPSPQSPGQEDAARRKAWLVELAAIGMEMARKTKADFDAAETPAERREAMGEFPAAARLVQRAIFLEAKLERDDRMEARLVAQDAAAAAREAVSRRKARAGIVVERLIEVAHPKSPVQKYDALKRLRWRLDDDFLEPDFADRPFDEVIRILCKSVGLPSPPAIGDDADLWAINLRREDASPSIPSADGRPSPARPRFPARAPLLHRDKSEPRICRIDTDGVADARPIRVHPCPSVVDEHPLPSSDPGSSPAPPSPARGRGC
jgi:hypothetical protein